MDKIFIEYLRDNLLYEIKELEKTAPTLSFLSKMTKQIKCHESYLTTFKIITSNLKGKLKNALKAEEKIKISTDRLSINGKILSIDENEILIDLNIKLNYGEYKLIRQTNYNNEIILKNLENFIKQNKKINIEIQKGWSENLKRRIKTFYKINLESEDEILSFLSKNCELENNFEVVKNINELINLDFKDVFSQMQRNLELPIEKNLYFDELLNESQKITIQEIFNKKSFKIIGPPGTGKTRTVVEIISQFLNIKKTVLVTGPSNISIDNIIEKFVTSKYFLKENPTFYRLGSSVKGLTRFNLEIQVEKKISFLKNDKNFKKIKDNLKKNYQKDLKENAKIVFSTLFSSLKEKRKFDWVIIDEACQASDVESFLALEKSEKFILVGDPNQLCPKSTSLFQKLCLKTFLLDLQYRMCSKLIQFSNEMFYDKKILSFKKLSVNLFDKDPLIFIDTDCNDFNETEDNNSKKNDGEAKIICKIIEYLQNYTKSDTIGIITPYSAQAALLKSLISEEIEVKTVDGFQGREKDYIILSLVRSNNMGDFGFLDDFRRLNVAITRSKKGLVVVGDSQNFRKSEIFTKFFKFIEKNFTIFDPSEVI